MLLSMSRAEPSQVAAFITLLTPAASFKRF